MTFVFSIGYYFDRFDANFIIATNIAKQLKKLGNECFLLAYSFHADKEEKRVFNDMEVTILPINPENAKYKKEYSEANKDKLSYSLSHPLKTLHYVARKTEDYKEIHRYIDKLVSKSEDSFLIGFVSPFEVSERIIRNNHSCPNVVYQLDPWGYHELFDRSKKEERIKKEISLFDSCSHIFTTDVLYEAYQNDPLYQKYTDKIECLYYPNLIEKKHTEKRFDFIGDDHYNLVFLGTLEDSYRNPDYLIRKVLALREEYRIDIRLFFIGNIQSQVAQNYAEQYDFIYIRESMPMKEAGELMNSDDIFLLNIGNTLKYQTPSKLIDYISSGNPIVNVVRIREDAYYSLLDEYDNGISLHEYEEDDNEKFYRFLMDHKGRKIKFEDLRRKFERFTPEYNADRIVRSLKGIRKNG